MVNAAESKTAETGSEHKPLFHIAFYRFANLARPDEVVARLQELTQHLLGSIIVAEEGINGMLSGTAAQLDLFEQQLADDPVWGDSFAGTVFKRTRCHTKPFARMKVYRKPEIVPLGIDGVDGRKTGINVNPMEWRKLIDADDVVLIDNRNSFEYRLGHFRNAIDPAVTHFRDFPEYIRSHAPQWKEEGKRVAMYCTGGIRCEKTTAWMRDLGMEVYQLEGGILNYFAQMPDADRDWQGNCFVFDNRIALNTRLEEAAVTPETVYEDDPDGEWRLRRAKQLAKEGG